MTSNAQRLLQQLHAPHVLAPPVSVQMAKSCSAAILKSPCYPYLAWRLATGQAGIAYQTSDSQHNEAGLQDLTHASPRDRILPLGDEYLFSGYLDFGEEFFTFTTISQQVSLLKFIEPPKNNTQWPPISADCSLAWSRKTPRIKRSLRTSLDPMQRIYSTFGTTYPRSWTSLS